MCTSFKDASDTLCDAIMACAQRLAPTYVDPACLNAYVACRLIPLDKQPGVRPIGIGEVLRRIIGKAILAVIGGDVQKAAGSLQLCAGQECGIEAAVHAMRQVFNSSKSECVLLADATNAFNSINREVCLRNVQHLCPALAPIAINCYRHSATLYVGGESMLSSEGTTQGDPIAMPLYAIATLPLLQGVIRGSQAWYADDAAAGGKVRPIRQWWDSLAEKGPSFGYLPNPAKSILLVKPEFLDEARRVFQSTGVQIRSDGVRYLGSAIGSPEFITRYIEEAARSRCDQLTKLSEIALTQPQAAYSAFVHGFKSKWAFLCRTTPQLAVALEQLDSLVTSKFIPALLSRPVSNMERTLLALPCRFGGLGLVVPSSMAVQHQSSLAITDSLVQRIVRQDPSLGDALVSIRTQKRLATSQSRDALRAEVTMITATLNADQQRVIQLASEKGASSWLTCRPLARHGFSLSKGEFRDGVYLRYNWLPDRLPSDCSCGARFTTCHALSCPTGGFPSIRHNEVRDITASLLKKVAHNVAVEPHLQPVTGEQFRYRSAIVEEQARLDVAASGRFERTFVDVRVFNPYASSNRATSLASTYTRQEKEKRRAYEQRIRDVEHASFVPAVFATTGGMSRHCTALYKRIACLLAEKSKEPYSVVMAWVRCRLSFALLRASVMCLRGSRSLKVSVDSTTPASLVAAEAVIPGH
eukprot:scpid56052/ scgid0290/ 